MTKIFALGVTGYVGGDAFHAISKAHPEYEWTCLVRNPDKGVLIAKEYPKARLVYGNLDSSELIKEEAGKADVVFNWADCDHEAAATAIISGLSTQTTPSFYIHTSGTAILMINDQKIDSFGQESTKIYDDLLGVGEVTSLPDAALHRVVDKIVLAGGEGSPKVNTAIVCPPCIYGRGRGPGNQRSIQVPELVAATIKRGKGFMVAEGRARWCEVHVQDLSNVYLRLVEEAIKGGGSATWGAEGYYFAESGEFFWGDVAAEIAKEAHKQGWIASPEADRLEPSEVKKLHDFGAGLWGQNSRGSALRAKKLLGWKPAMPSLKEDVPRSVEFEAERLGLKKGHAAVAAGQV